MKNTVMHMLISLIALPVFAQASSQALELPMPKWTVGQTWEVRKWIVTSCPIPMTNQFEEKMIHDRDAEFLYKFKVIAIESVSGKECYKIEIVHQEKMLPKMLRTTIISFRKDTMQPIDYCHKMEWSGGNSRSYSGVFVIDVLGPINTEDVCSTLLTDVW